MLICKFCRRRLTRFDGGFIAGDRPLADAPVDRYTGDVCNHGECLNRTGHLTRHGPVELAELRAETEYAPPYDKRWRQWSPRYRDLRYAIDQHVRRVPLPA
jgi:hypothetical protein